MTVKNCIARYQEYLARGQSKAAEDMKQHMLKAKKFKGHPFLAELLPKKDQAKPKSVASSKEVGKNGKKPKR